MSEFPYVNGRNQGAFEVRKTQFKTFTPHFSWVTSGSAPPSSVSDLFTHKMRWWHWPPRLLRTLKETNMFMWHQMDCTQQTAEVRSKTGQPLKDLAYQWQSVSSLIQARRLPLLGASSCCPQVDCGATRAGPHAEGASAQGWQMLWASTWVNCCLSSFHGRL